MIEQNWNKHHILEFATVRSVFESILFSILHLLYGIKGVHMLLPVYISLALEKEMSYNTFFFQLSLLSLSLCEGFMLLQ